MGSRRFVVLGGDYFVADAEQYGAENCSFFSHSSLRQARAFCYVQHVGLACDADFQEYFFPLGTDGRALRFDLWADDGSDTNYRFRREKFRVVR